VCPPFVILSEANHVRQRVAPSVHAENRRGGNAATPSPASYENIVSREPRRPLRRPALTPSALARSRRRPPPRGDARGPTRDPRPMSARWEAGLSLRARLSRIKSWEMRTRARTTRFRGHRGLVLEISSGTFAVPTLVNPSRVTILRETIANISLETKA